MLHSAVNGQDSVPYPGQLRPGVGQAAPSSGARLLSGQLPPLPELALPELALLVPALLVPAAPPLALPAAVPVSPPRLVELPPPLDFPPHATARNTDKIQTQCFITLELARHGSANRRARCPQT